MVMWRVIRDWIDAQIAMVDAGAGELEQVFLAWELLSNDQTFFERRQAMRQLPGPTTHEER